MAARSSRRSCPCQHIPLSLSSATAAEYGDVESLSRRLYKRTQQRQQPLSTSSISNAGITPLHLAAQHDHPAAVSYLLSEGKCDVDTGLHTNDTAPFCGATPLHRASFSGAISSMQILLDWGSNSGDNGPVNRANILAKDSSFGDLRTPLHKAVAGGRPLAVQLILMSLRQRNLVRDGLAAVDSQGFTPLTLVRQFTTLNTRELEKEKCSVRRWDSIAGGVADWKRCHCILENASKSTTLPSDITKMDELKPFEKKISLLCTEGNRCTDETCRTAAWENAFRSALAHSLGSFMLTSDEESSMQLKPLKNLRNNAQNDGSADKHHETNKTEAPTVCRKSDVHKQTFGRACEVCTERSASLFYFKNNLVCKRCRRTNS